MGFISGRTQLYRDGDCNIASRFFEGNRQRRGRLSYCRLRDNPRADWLRYAEISGRVSTCLGVDRNVVEGNSVQFPTTAAPMNTNRGDRCSQA